MPRLNVKSPFLVFCFNIPPWDLPSKLDWRSFKNAFNAQLGGLSFIETFEAWGVRDIKNAILEFKNDESLMDFVDCMEKRQIFESSVSYNILCEKNRNEFFDFVCKKTGVDLVQCGAIPPSRKSLSRLAAPPRTRNPKRVSPTSIEQQQKMEEVRVPVDHTPQSTRSKQSRCSQASTASTSSVVSVPPSGFVIIKNIPDSDALDIIKVMAEKCGKVVSISVKTFATVEYYEEESVQEAKRTLHNKMVDGAVLQVVEYDGEEIMRKVEQDLIELDISDERQSRVQEKSTQPTKPTRGISPFNYVEPEPLERKVKTFPVFFCNIPEKYSLYQLVQLASVAGEVSAVVPWSQAIVEFDDEADVSKAVASINGCVFEENKVEAKQYCPR